MVKDHTISNHTGWTILRAMATRKGEKLVGMSISPSYILLVNHADKVSISSVCACCKIYSWDEATAVDFTTSFDSQSIRFSLHVTTFAASVL